ncbi:MAG: metallopeptidase TldD-related protein [Bacteroidota bacterium]|nr:metallopeptidase TldD-related protein [Bacteroidota bacterium]
MTQDEGKRIIERLLGVVKADEVFIALSYSHNEILSLSPDRILSSTANRDTSVQLSVRVGDRYATVTGNRLDEDSLAALAARAVETARLLPKSDTLLHYTGAADIPPSSMAVPSEAPARKVWREEQAARIIEEARVHNLRIGGSLATGSGAAAVASSNGLFAYQPSTYAACSLRVYTGDGKAASYVDLRARTAADIDPASAFREAVRRALASTDPLELPPGRYTVILEAPAVAELLLTMMRQFDMQAVEERRSFLRKLDGTPQIGAELFSRDLTVFSDPYHTHVPSQPFTPDGQRIVRKEWVRNGVVASVTVGRVTAQKREVEPVPFPSNLVVEGTTTSLDELIATTKRGLLVPFLTPAFVEDASVCMMAASTQGGVFLIEEGRVGRAVRNMTLRETAVHLFREIDRFGTALRTSTRSMAFPMHVPPLRIRDVMFSGPSGRL